MGLTGETNLTALLSSLLPRLDPVEYAFGMIPDGQVIPPAMTPIGTFREPQGLTIIAAAGQFSGTGIAHSPGWAMITLAVHSSLQAVGMIAAIAAALADAGISANVVAGYHHDHIFVPWDRRDEAVQILQNLGD